MDHQLQVSLIKELFDLQRHGRHKDMLGEVMHLPSNIYTDSEILNDEMQTVFRHYPILAGHASRLSEPGSYILSDWDKFPFVIVRDNDGRLRAYLNSCRHRGAKLASGEEETLKAFVCPFHGWSYGLDGKLKAVTRPHNFPALDRESCSLREFPVEESNGLIWVHPTFGENIDIKTYLGPFADDLKSFEIDKLSSYKKTRVIKNANWKMLLKTYLEGYHVPYLHRNTLQKAFKNGVIAHDGHGPHLRLVAARTNFTEAKEVPENDWNILDFASVYYSLFPNAFFIMHPDYVSINMFYPEAPNRTIWTHEMLYRPEQFKGQSGHEALEKRFKFTNDAVFDREDFAVAEGVQSNIDFARDETHLLGIEEGLLGVFQRSVDDAIKTNNLKANRNAW